MSRFSRPFHSTSSPRRYVLGHRLRFEDRQAILAEPLDAELDCLRDLPFRPFDGVPNGDAPRKVRDIGRVVRPRNLNHNGVLSTSIPPRDSGTPYHTSMQRQVRAVAVEERGYAEIASVGLLLAVLAGFALFLYCRAEEQTVPVTGRTQRVALSEEDQAKLGAEAYRDILAGSATEIVRTGPEATLVRRTGERIAAVADDPGFVWEFTLIASPAKNAWCLPGGKVAIYSGILEVAQDEDGLAVVMAHEIAHAIAQHGAERMLQEQLTRVGLLALSTTLGGLDPASRGALLALFGAGAQLGVLLPFSRDMESEADRIGLIYMARAGYNPEAAIGFWERMAAAREGPEPPEYASTHPSDATRIANLQKWLPEAMEEYRKTTETGVTMLPQLPAGFLLPPAPAQRMAATSASD